MGRGRSVARSVVRWRTTIACSLARVQQKEKEDDATPRGSNERARAADRTRDETRREAEEEEKEDVKSARSAFRFLPPSLSPSLSSRSLSRFPPEISVNVKVKEGASGGAAKEARGFLPACSIPRHERERLTRPPRPRPLSLPFSVPGAIRQNE